MTTPRSTMARAAVRTPDPRSDHAPLVVPFGTAGPARSGRRYWLSPKVGLVLSVAVVGLGALVACSDDGTDVVAGDDVIPVVDDRPADGTSTARIVATYAASGSIELDDLVLLDGDAARAAAVAAGDLAEGEDLPNDVYLLDEDDTTRRVTVSPDATVEVLDCSSACELVEVPVADVFNGDLAPYGGEHALWTVEVTDGLVTTLTEVYLP